MFFRTIRMMVAGGLFLGFFSASWAADRKDGSSKSLRPEVRPKVNEKHLEGFRKSHKEIAELHDAVQQTFVELGATMGEMEAATPKEKRKIEKRVRVLRGDIVKERRKLDRLLKKEIVPLEKRYSATRTKHDGLVAKAKEKEEQGDAKRAQKYHQEASKINGSMSSDKRNLDLFYYHLFFEGEEVFKDGE